MGEGVELWCSLICSEWGKQGICRIIQPNPTQSSPPAATGRRTSGWWSFLLEEWWMEKMGTANRELEHLFEDKKRVRNPLVPFGTTSRPFSQKSYFVITNILYLWLSLTTKWGLDRPQYRCVIFSFPGFSKNAFSPYLCESSYMVLVSNEHFFR